MFGKNSLNGKIMIGYKYQIYPNKEQEVFLEKCINVSRYVYNWAYNIEQEQYIKWKNGESDKGFLSLKEMQKLFYEMRNNTEFVKEIPCTTGRNAVFRLVSAFEKFFDYSKKKNKHPVPKSKKRSKKSFTTNGHRMYFDNDKLRIEGLVRKDTIDIKVDSNFTKNNGPKYFYNPVITKDTCNRFWISFTLPEDKDKYKNIYDIEEGTVLGVDINKNNISTSDGTVYLRPNIKRDLKRLADMQRKYSKDIKRHKEQEKANPDTFIPLSKRALKRKLKQAKQYNKIHNKQENFIQQVSSKIAKSKYESIVLETLDISDMKSNTFVAHELQFTPMYRASLLIDRKSVKYGKNVIYADKNYPSSKLCSNCGYLKENMKTQKIFFCPNCGAKIDRDINASINLSFYKPA